MFICDSIVSGIFFQAKYWHSHIWPGFATMIFGTWLMWDIIAIQIDLTPDEYIIGALDLYLDIVNLILWLLIDVYIVWKWWNFHIEKNEMYDMCEP